MKITAVYECEVSGGTDRLLTHLIKNWPDKGAEWTVLCHSKNSGIGLLKNELGSCAKIMIYSAGNWKRRTLKIVNLFILLLSSTVQYLYFRQVFKKNKPDLVYLHQGGYPGGFSEHAAGMAAKTLDSGIKVITSIQNLPAMRDRKLFSKIMDKLTNGYVDHFIFASRYTRDEYVEKTSLRLLSMHVINEGVTANIENKRLKNSTNIVNIGIIGAYQKRKGHRVFFDAISALARNGVSNFAVHCYGQSRYGEFEEVVEYARRKNIYGLINWHEYEADFDKLYGPLDIVVQASVEGESMPLVPIDAAAYYKPVIASRLQGLVEVVTHGVTGYLFDIGDSAALARCLEDLIGDSDKRERMGKAARKRFEERFTAARMAREYYGVFSRCKPYF